MTYLVDPLTHRPVVQPRSLTEHRPDDLTVEHRVHHSGGESLVDTATRFNRAIRDKRIQRPGRGRWVEYVFPDLQRRYVEANLRKVYRGVMPDEDVTARVVLKPGYDDYTNDLQQLLLMRVADVSGDMLDVVRTAGLVGLHVQDPETRGNTDITNGGGEPRRQKVGSMSLVKEAGKRMAAGALAGAAAGVIPGAIYGTIGGGVGHILAKQRAGETDKEFSERKSGYLRTGLKAGAGIGAVLGTVGGAALGHRQDRYHKNQSERLLDAGRS